MRKLITPIRQSTSSSGVRWLELDRAASVEVTSEVPEHPIEGALVRGYSRGWRASTLGIQIVRLVFDDPINIETIKVVFEEHEAERTQEFVLRWTSSSGSSGEIVRQQWNFSPFGATREAEHFNVQLARVTTLELIINPDIRGGPAHASLTKFRVA